MTLPSIPPLSLADIAIEFNAPTTGIEITDFYAGGAYVPAATEGDGGPIPSSGVISVANFYGASNKQTDTIVVSVATNNLRTIGYGINPDTGLYVGARNPTTVNGKTILGLSFSTFLKTFAFSLGGNQVGYDFDYVKPKRGDNNGDFLYRSSSANPLGEYDATYNYTSWVWFPPSNVTYEDWRLAGHLNPRNVDISFFL